MAEQTSQLTDLLHNVGVHTAYGEPVDIDGTKIVPVAAAGYGFGMGNATEGGEGEASENGFGSGSGGCGYAFPLGAYVTRDGYTRFEPNAIALAAVAIPLVCVAGRAFARIIRAFKK